MSQRVEVGSFVVESGRLLVADPDHYHPSTESNELGAYIEVENGIYRARVDTNKWGVTVMVVYADGIDPSNLVWSSEGGSVNVDSGSITICDARHYRRDQDVVEGMEGDAEIYGVGDRWWSMVHRIVYEPPEYGIIPNGVVTRGGDDTLFDVEVSRSVDGRVRAIRVVFWPDDDPDTPDNVQVSTTKPSLPFSAVPKRV